MILLLCIKQFVHTNERGSDDGAAAEGLEANHLSFFVKKFKNKCRKKKSWDKI